MSAEKEARHGERLPRRVGAVHPGNKKFYCKPCGGSGGGEDFPTPSLRHFAGGIKVVNEEEEAAGVEKRKRAFLKALHRSGRETARIFLPASTAKVYHLFIG